MNIHLIAIGKHMPAWVQAGYEDYAQRLSNDVRLQLIEIEAGRRGKNADLKRILQEEGKRMLAAIPKGTQIITLDAQGKQFDTPMLARQLQQWQLDGRDISLLVGGPEGLAPVCNAKAEQKWSLSFLTLPHPLVRIVVAEQIYRAWSILHHHPYHRE